MNTSTHPEISTHPNKIQRSLAAIVITDAVGFSQWMSRDEDTALTIINRDLQIIQDLCVSFEGKILKTTGDGVLMYFISGVQAASCAIEIQKTFASFPQNDQTQEHFTHRIGVHLGDIFFNQDDMMGTSVNIAARLESEAKPGAVCMSQVVYEVVKYKLNLDAVYAGELSLKNIEQSVSAYHVWPSKIQTHKSPEQFGEAILSLITPLNATLKVFASHPQRHRIKKLLYATHKGIWENNPDTLKNISLKLLVESLTNQNANLDECQNSLNKIIRTLSHQKRYHHISQIILENIKDFYVSRNLKGQIVREVKDQSCAILSTQKKNVLNISQPNHASPNDTSPNHIQACDSQHHDAQPSCIERDPTVMWSSLTTIIRNVSLAPIHKPMPNVILRTLKEFYAESSDGSRINIERPSQLENILREHQSNKTHLQQEITNQLNQSKNKIRMKQILYCVCCGQWETYTDRIQAVPMLALVQELDRHVDNPKMLYDQLYKVLLGLENRTPYTPAANELFKVMRPLYTQLSKPSSHNICFRRERLRRHLKKTVSVAKSIKI